MTESRGCCLESRFDISLGPTKEVGFFATHLLRSWPATQTGQSLWWCWPLVILEIPVEILFFLFFLVLVSLSLSASTIPTHPSVLVSEEIERVVVEGLKPEVVTTNWRLWWLRHPLLSLGQIGILGGGSSWNCCSCCTSEHDGDIGM